MKTSQTLARVSVCSLLLLAADCKPRLDSADRGDRLRAVQSPELTDQNTIANIALTDSDLEVRMQAVEKLTDQALLDKLAVEAKDAYVRLTALAKLSDQALLAKVAIEDTDSGVRKAAMARLTDQAIVARIAVEAKDVGVRQAAVTNFQIATRTDETVLAKVAVESNNADIRKVVLAKLSDQALLAKVAVEDKDWSVRQAAASRLRMAKIAGQPLTANVVDATNLPVRQSADAKLSDPMSQAYIVFGEREGATLRRATALLNISNEELMLALARGEPDMTVRTTAILLLTNQTELKHFASKNPMALVREAAVVGVTDEAFLLRRAREDSSAAVRLAIVRGLHSPEAIYSSASHAYYKPVREAALARLKDVAPEKVRAVGSELESQAEAVASANESSLAQFAIHGEFDVLCRAAAERLVDTASLKRVVLESNDREVVKIAIGKLTDPALLADISANSSIADQAVRLAASRKAGQRSWTDIFRSAANDPKALGDAVAAVALFGDVQNDANEGVEQACLVLIRRGDESRIPEMADLLEGYGSKRLAEDYLNCGQPDLHNAGVAWAHKRGYDVGTGNGSNRAQWGGK